MKYVKTEVCSGCGECVSVCPTGAIRLQNDIATIDQELCQECEVCVNSCPQGAILVYEPEWSGSQVIKIPTADPIEIVEMDKQTRLATLQNAVLPAVGSALAWTGREVLPRLANLAIDYLDRRLQSPEIGTTNPNIQMSGRGAAHSKGSGRRRRQRQHRKGKLR